MTTDTIAEQVSTMHAGLASPDPTTGARRAAISESDKQGPGFAPDLRGRDGRRQPTANSGKRLLA